MKIGYCKTNLESSGYVTHGLGLLSAIARAAGHESYWINASCPPMSAADWFRDNQFDAVAITACSDAFPAAKDMAEKAKAARGDTLVFVGGPHATFVPDDFMAVPEVDYIVRGEGEVVWESFCSGTPPSDKVVVGESPLDLNVLPFVDRNQERDFSIKTEHPPIPLHAHPGPYRCVLAGRGCRYNCAFCKPGTDLIFGKKSRRRSVDSVMNELGSLAPFGSLFIHDDNLIEDEEWCDEFVERWDGRPFLAQGRPDLMVHREALLERMVAGGLRCMLVGFESGSDKVLKAMRKGTTRDINIRAADIGHRLGIHMQANMIYGTPGETKDDVLQSISLVRNHLQPCTHSPAVYTPYPGSDWGKLCDDNGWNMVKDTYEYSRGLGGRKLSGDALGYTYEWLHETLR